MPSKLQGKPRIVVTDDDSRFMDMVKSWLIARYDVYCISNPKDLPERLPDIEPDLLILNIQMQGGGLGLCRQIRSDSRFSSLPVLFLTAVKMEESVVDGLNVGGDACLTKPVNGKQLHAKLEELLTGSPQRR